ncbi:MAG: hypothetical protein HGB19_11215 [Chlorobiales bacterium]|jgi:hypothetical protein|nr:hypothetical protein [Chlorobiales bacterium]
MSHINPLWTDEQLKTIGKVLIEKYESISSKESDQTSTSSDLVNLNFASEIIALAKNRLHVDTNEALAADGKSVWTERTSGHYPHIRLHGGALEDDFPLNKY